MRTHNPLETATALMRTPHGPRPPVSSARGPAEQMAKRALTQAMLHQFSDSEWHALRDIAAYMAVDIASARQLCHRLVSRGAFKTFGERRRASPAQGGWSYRWIKGGKQLSLEAFYAEVGPVLDDMEALIYGHSVDFSQQAMKIAYAKFRQVLDRVAR